MFSAFLYFFAMALTIPGLPRLVNELLTGSKMVRFVCSKFMGDPRCLPTFIHTVVPDIFVFEFCGDGLSRAVCL